MIVKQYWLYCRALYLKASYTLRFRAKLLSAKARFCSRLGAFSPHLPSTAIAFLHQLAYNIEVTQGVPRLRLRWGIASDPHNLMKLILT